MSVEGDTTMLALYYSIDHPDPDNNFTVTVVPINGAGPGEDAVTTIQLNLSSSLPILSLSHSLLSTTVVIPGILVSVMIIVFWLLFC